MKKYKVGDPVRFTKDNLGASDRDDLGHTTGEMFGIGDGGVVAFPHPNKTVATAGWFYVEVDSKRDVGRKVYVGVRLDMVDPGTVR